MKAKVSQKSNMPYTHTYTCIYIPFNARLNLPLSRNMYAMQTQMIINNFYGVLNGEFLEVFYSYWVYIHVCTYIFIFTITPCTSATHNSSGMVKRCWLDGKLPIVTTHLKLVNKICFCCSCLSFPNKILGTTVK